MPLIVNNTTSLGNVKENSRGTFYQVDYCDPIRDVESWQLYDMTVNPPETRLNQQIWYRRASLQRHVEVTYKMQAPLAFIPGNYRIEVFIPDQHASVTKASFTVTDRLGEHNLPIETMVTINMIEASNEWVSLGEYTLDIDLGPLIGQVRQFDDTDGDVKTHSGKDREITFGPVRWVPLYQPADPLYVGLDDANNCRFQYLDPTQQKLLEQQWSPRTVFDPGDTQREWFVKFRRRSELRQIQVDYSLPATALPGQYRIEAFIPQVFFTRSTQAIYQIKTGIQIVNGEKIYTEKTVMVDQSKFANQWAPLGKYELTPDPQPDPESRSLVGQVSQFDDSGDAQNVFITFAPIRWVPCFEAEIKPSQQFDLPVGDQDQRSRPFAKNQFGTFSGNPKWLENWYDATPYLTPYKFGIHTGADLNLTNFEDFLQPVFAAGDGKVIYAGPAGGTWNFIIVIEHPLAWVRLEDGRKVQRKVYTRYGHVSNLLPDHLIQVKDGDEVMRGQHIGFIGFMKGFTTEAHLHFDVSYTERLKDLPSHWPQMTEVIDAMKNKGSDPVTFQNAVRKFQNIVRQDYLDPLQFLVDNHDLTMANNPAQPPG